MTVLPMARPGLRNVDAPRDPLSRYRYRSPVQDSPGGDVARRHPTLPDSAYYEAVRAATEREEALELHGQNGSPTIVEHE